MKFAFDLISDLHAETWPQLDWTQEPTSPLCVVAGDVAKDWTLLEETLRHLTQCYQAVFYIDGNDEHKNYWYSIADNVGSIADICAGIPRLVYLQDNVVIINGVAILGTNGWWDWNFQPEIDQEQCQAWFCEHYQAPSIIPEILSNFALSDAKYLHASVKRLQTHQDVKKIVIVTHTVPNSRFVEHDIEIMDSYRANVMGNSLMSQVLSADSERKISHWCFGHYHGSVDTEDQGIRFVNNCRGRGNTMWRQAVYHPLRIEIEF